MAMVKIKFMGREYTFPDGPHDLFYIVRYQDIRGDYYAKTCGSLAGMNLWEDGSTPQKAATALEKRCIERFKHWGEAMGYEVTG